MSFDLWQSLFLGYKSIQYRHRHASLARLFRMVDGHDCHMIRYPNYIFKDNLGMVYLTSVLGRVACLGLKELDNSISQLFQSGFFFEVRFLFSLNIMS